LNEEMGGEQQYLKHILIVIQWKSQGVSFDENNRIERAEHFTYRTNE